jgi:hypothetical protein
VHEAIKQEKSTAYKTEEEQEQEQGEDPKPLRVLGRYHEKTDLLT